MKLEMLYGSSGLAGTRDSSLVYSGIVDDENAVDLIFDAGGMYMLYTTEHNAPSGAYRGHRAILIKVPEDAVYGSTACAHINAAASTNSGVSITYNSDSSVTVARSSATYAVRYAVYKIL